jgi:beta-mannosidase
MIGGLRVNKQQLGDWSFKACDEQQWLPAKVPGCVHTDLLRNEVITDPFYGTNEKDLQWIDKKDWEYTSTFDLSEELQAVANLALVFDGLDTYAEVTLNGKKVLESDNMFRVWKADVKDLLRSKANELHIRFKSPVQHDLPRLEQLGYGLPANNDQSEIGGLGDKKISGFARKAPYHYGWDWGPRFVTSGIWREVRLEGWSDIRISDLFIRQDKVDAASAKLTAIVEIESEQARLGVLRISTEGMKLEKSVELKAGLNTVELEVELLNPQLWWSVGLGEPHQYTFKAEWVQEEKALVQRTVRTGLRSIRLVREKDVYGATFYIELNGVPVFAKGSNHIPNDSFISEVTAERYRHEIASAAQSNMNMLRVWGGGIYEADVFYDLCDEYGLMVWQDFMFACGMYPGDDAFLDNVRMEAEDNIRRLRNHPSIVLWCGNNEIDTAWSHHDENAGWGWKNNYSLQIRDKIWADYEAIFHHVLPDTVERNAPGAEYWPSSPMYGLTGDAVQHATKSSAAGDIHYWGVWHSVEPFEKYNINIGRFMSEYGFQSFPEYETVRTYAEESDLTLDSDIMRAHQKSGDGNRLIKEYMDIYMKEPKDFSSFLYMSQVLQGEAMKTGIEAHRRRKPYCMGSLYWQMNDSWPGASWSGVDYYGRWKAMQYYVKRSFQPVLLSIDGTIGGFVSVHLVSDLLTPISGKLTVTLYDFDGTQLRELSQVVELSANTAGVVFSATETELLQGANPSSVVMVARLKQEGLPVESKEHYFVNTQHLDLSAAEITITEIQGDGGPAYSLSTNRLAKQVWLSTEVEGIFTDNFFDLIPGQVKTVQFYARTEEDSAFGKASTNKIIARSMSDFIV